MACSHNTVALHQSMSSVPVCWDITQLHSRGGGRGGGDWGGWGGGGGGGVGRGGELCPKASVVFLLCFVVVFLVVFRFCIRSYYCATVKAQADKRYMSVMLFPTLKVKMYLWRSLRTLHLLACHVGVTVRDSGLRCCVCVMSSDR